MFEYLCVVVDAFSSKLVFCAVYIPPALHIKDGISSLNVAESHVECRPTLPFCEDFNIRGFSECVSNGYKNYPCIIIIKTSYVTWQMFDLLQK